MSNSRKNLALNNQNEVISSYYSNIKVTKATVRRKIIIIKGSKKIKQRLLGYRLKRISNMEYHAII